MRTAIENPIFTGSALKKLIVPLLIEQVLAITVGMMDTMMISSVGEAAVSGVSLVDMINVVLINIFAAMATGGAVVTAQFIGSKRTDRACESAHQLLLIASILSLFIMALVLVLKQPLLRLFFGNIEKDVMEHALVYLTISAISYPFLAIYNSCAALFRSMGNSKISMQTSLLMNIINIAGNFILIFGLHMGVAGAAVASLIARITAAAIMVIRLSNPENQVHIERKFRVSFHVPMIKNILRIGIPNGLENSFFQLGRVLVVSIIAGFGTVQIAANAVANNIDALGIIPGQAMNLAMITVVGQCVGAADYKQAIYYIKKLLKITYSILVGLNIVIFICLPLILKVYQLSEETLSLAFTLIFIHNGCAVFLWPLSFTLPNALRAANDVRYTMVVSIFSMAAFRLAFSYVLGVVLGMGAIGVWLAMVMDWIFRVSCFVTRFLRGKWKKYEMTVERGGV